MPRSPFIVKLQWPITGSEVLLYNEDKSIFELFFPTTSEWKAQMRGRLKIYFHAHIDANGILHLDDVAEDQSW